MYEQRRGVPLKTEYGMAYTRSRLVADVRLEQELQCKLRVETSPHPSTGVWYQPLQTYTGEAQRLPLCPGVQHGSTA